MKCEICSGIESVEIRHGLAICESCFSEKMILPGIPLGQKLKQMKGELYYGKEQNEAAETGLSFCR